MVPAPQRLVPVAYVVTVPSEPSSPALPVTSGPFGAGQVWAGRYTCPQGPTELSLIVLEARDYQVRALFDFFHAPSGAKGSYLVSGQLNRKTGRFRLRPEAWVVQPHGYVMVGLAGAVVGGGTRLSGRITDPGCGAFEVELQARD